MAQADQIVVVSLTIEGKYGQRTLALIAKSLLGFIKTEAKKDFVKREVGVADRSRLINSFTQRVRPPETIEILSDWPMLDRLVEGSRPFRMKWLNRKDGVSVVPIMDRTTKKIVFRAPPLTTGKAWIHPAIAKHSFVNRAVERAYDTIIDYFLEGHKDMIVNEFVGAFKEMKAEKA